MCDTFAIGPEFTGSGISIFGKNSDREPDETQLVQALPAATYQPREDLRCTYITIPQVSSTHALIVSKPFWLWGAEMGVNEKGVVIGNEALFTRVRKEKSPGLIGMDLLRLALERAADAQEAAQVIISLLKEYGQAGACGYRHKKFSYMNSFLVMDRHNIIKLETAGRDYVLKDAGSQAAISNAITIAQDWDSSSLAPNTDFSKFSDPFMTYLAGGTFRKERNETSIRKAKGSLGTRHVLAMLRDHYDDAPGKGFNRDVCMHAAGRLIRRSQTTASMVVELHPDSRFRVFVTGGSGPCLTAFKPFLPTVPFAETGIGAGYYSADSYWWRHEVYHISTVLRYSSVRPLAQKYIQGIEEKYLAEFPPHRWDSSDSALIEASRKAFKESEEREKMIVDRMKKMTRQTWRPSSLFWRRMAKRSGVPVI